MLLTSDIDSKGEPLPIDCIPLINEDPHLSKMYHVSSKPMLGIWDLPFGSRQPLEAHMVSTAEIAPFIWSI